MFFELKIAIEHEILIGCFIIGISMKEKARQYKPSTVRRLDTLSGNQCAAPGCTRSLIAKDGETILSKICHIEAASENRRCRK